MAAAHDFSSRLLKALEIHGHRIQTTAKPDICNQCPEISTATSTKKFIHTKITRRGWRIQTKGFVLLRILYGQIDFGNAVNNVADIAS